MKKNILIISTSPRKGGNSDLLADEFLRGVKETENTVEKITLHDKTIGFCRGCLACQTTGKCVIKDDANAIVEQILHADVLVFATPVYFFEMSGQMKTLLDRTNPLFPTDYKFREIYLLAAAGEEEEHSVDGTVHGLQGWIDCFGKAKLAGVVRGVNSVVKGDIQKNITALTTAYEMGKNV